MNRNLYANFRILTSLSGNLCIYATGVFVIVAIYSTVIPSNSVVYSLQSNVLTLFKLCVFVHLILILSTSPASSLSVPLVSWLCVCVLFVLLSFGFYNFFPSILNFFSNYAIVHMTRREEKTGTKKNQTICIVLLCGYGKLNGNPFILYSHLLSHKTQPLHSIEVYTAADS